MEAVIVIGVGEIDAICGEPAVSQVSTNWIQLVITGFTTLGLLFNHLASLFSAVRVRIVSRLLQGHFDD